MRPEVFDNSKISVAIRGGVRFWPTDGGVTQGLKAAKHKDWDAPSMWSSERKTTELCQIARQTTREDSPVMGKIAYP